MGEVFRVTKVLNQPIRAYKKSTGEIGAEMERDDFIAALVEEAGSPAFVMTKAQLLARLIVAAQSLQLQMQATTAAVAGAQIPDEVKAG